jgi:hypothetical protein
MHGLSLKVETLVLCWAPFFELQLDVHAPIPVILRILADP